MNKIFRRFAVLFLIAAPAFYCAASSMLPISPLEHVKRSAAVFRGEVLQLKCFVNTNDGHIYTTAFIKVDETFKGILPPIVKLTHRGGTSGGFGELDGSYPILKIGETRLFFATVRPDGTACLLRGDASTFLLPDAATGLSTPQTVAGEVSLTFLRNLSASNFDGGGSLVSQAASSQSLALAPAGNNPPSGGPGSSATNLTTYSTPALAGRFIAPDRGEPIPYLVDADYLPAGMTLNQGLGTVSNALAAWAAVTSAKFTFLGIQSFGQASFNVTNQDGVLRIQLHDHYNYIGGGGGSGDTLGLGGQYVSLSALSGTSWTGGGNVRGNDFYQTLRAALVLTHTNIFMTNITNFSEVLCHEIGHTLGMAHSSQSNPEPNAYLSNSIMYFQAHGNGRGATLGAYDPPVIQQSHPQSNLPPYMYPRVMHVVTSPSAISTPGVNVIQTRVYSVENKTLILATNNDTHLNGHFSLTGSNLTYVANGYFGDASYDPAGNTFADGIYARCSDTTNASPFVLIRVMSYGADSSSEGIPDSWRLTYFGNASPNVGANHHATNDADGDGYSNITEFQIGSNPANALSNLRITNQTATNFHWQAAPYEVYEILGSTNLITWQRATNPITPTNTDGAVNVNVSGLPKKFYRVERVP